LEFDDFTTFIEAPHAIRAIHNCGLTLRQRSLAQPITFIDVGVLARAYGR